jgi:hypothetical protein
MSAPQHFLQIERDMRPIVVCTALAGAPCRMVCATCEESCSCGEPHVDMGECNWSLWLNESDNLIEDGSGVALLPIDVKWEGDYYSWAFTKPVSA